MADLENPLSGNCMLRSPWSLFVVGVICAVKIKKRSNGRAEADPQFMHRTQDSIIVN